MPPKLLASQEKLIRVKDRSIARKEAETFKDAVELMNLLIPHYMQETGKNIDILTPFGGIVKFVRFDNTEGAPLQIKVQSSEERHPGSAGGAEIKWPEYKTFCAFLDQIDVIDKRDYSIAPCDDPNLEKLRKEGLEVIDRYDEEKIDDKNLKEKKEKFFKDGIGRKALATQLLDCMSYVPSAAPELEVSQIPDYLNGLMATIGHELKIFESHETDHVRAASMMFGIAFCEVFRTPGALKHFRQCLRVVKEEGIPFSKVFGDSLTGSICFLSPTGGTSATREVFESGISPTLIEERKKGWYLSDSSEDEMPKAQRIKIKATKALKPEPKQDLSQGK